MFSNLLKNISPVVKNILIINILFFVTQLTFPIFMGGLSLYPFGSEGFKPWQLATHFFMHDPKSIGHIFFNMFAVVIFGTQLERVWGPKKFLGYYIACAFGAAILHQIVIQIEISNLKDYFSNEQWYIIKENGYSILNQLREINYDNLSFNEKLKIYNEINNNYDLYLKNNNYLFPLIVKMNSYMLGASGAVFGLLAAFGYLFPNTELMLLFPPIPIKAKYFVIGYAALELYLGISNNPSDNVAHFAHLGGALVGIIIVLYWGKNRTSFF